MTKQIQSNLFGGRSPFRRTPEMAYRRYARLGDRSIGTVGHSVASGARDGSDRQRRKPCDATFDGRFRAEPIQRRVIVAPVLRSSRTASNS